MGERCRLTDLHRILKESLRRDELMSEELRALNKSEKTVMTSPNNEKIGANLDLRALMRVLIDSMETSIAAIDDVREMLGNQKSNDADNEKLKTQEETKNDSETEVEN